MMKSSRPGHSVASVLAYHLPLLFFTFTAAFADTPSEPWVVEPFEPTFSGERWEFPGATVSPRRLVSMSDPRSGAGALELDHDKAGQARYSLADPLREGWLEIWVGVATRTAAEITLSHSGDTEHATAFRFLMPCNDPSGGFRWELGGVELPMIAPDPPVREGRWQRVVVERMGTRLRVFHADQQVAEAEIDADAWDTLTLRVPENCPNARARFDDLRIGTGETPIHVRTSTHDLAAMLEAGGRFFTLELGVGGGIVDASPTDEAPTLAADLPAFVPYAYLRFAQRTARSFSLGFAASMLQHDVIDRIFFVTAEGLVYDPSRRFYVGFGVGPALLSGSDQITAQAASDNGLGVKLLAGADYLVSRRMSLGLRIEGHYLDAGAVDNITGVLAGLQLGYWIRR